MVWLFNLQVERVVLVHDHYGTDNIYFCSTKEQAEKIHGPYIDVMRGCNFNIEVTRGRGEEVLKELRVPSDITEVVDLTQEVG